jgi:Uncharacterised protein family (UPF0259)
VNATGGKLSLREVADEMWRVYRRHWTFLVPTAIIVLLPQSIADALVEGFHVDHLRSATDFATFGAALLVAAVNLLGQAAYAGLTAAAVVDWRAGLPLPPLSTLLRAMPLRRLLVLDLLITLGWAIGFTLLVIPGLIFLTYVGISPVVLKLEHLSVREAIRRSIQLVRGHARQVFAIVVGGVIFSELAVQAVALPFENFGVLTVVNLVAEGIFQPIEGLAIALAGIHLLELRGEAAEPSTMARSLVTSD